MEGKESESLLLPYAFSTNSMGSVFGIGAMRKGFVQPQMVSAVTAFAGGESLALAAAIFDFRLPYSERWFFTGIGMAGYYPRNRLYTSTAHFTPSGEVRAGSNNSSDTEFIEASGHNNWSDLLFEYAMPMGATAESGQVNYQLRRGLLVSPPSGGETWNPLQSGGTVLVFRQYNRYQSYELTENVIDGRVRAASIGILYDNTDFPVNPEKGSRQYVAVHFNPIDADSNKYWDFIELDASKFFSFGESKWARQRVLALNLWLGYSPSWELIYDEAKGFKPKHNPPPTDGASLGGYYHLRGFDQYRYYDKAAMSFSAEYRYTLEYNPSEGVSWLNFLHMDWLQVAVFFDAGRVSSHFDASLFKEIKSNAGVGLRALMAGTVVRFDMGISEEGLQGWVMIGQPF